MAMIGSSVSVGKLVTSHLPVFLASGLRYAISVALLALMLLAERQNVRSIAPRQYGLMFLQSFTGQFLFSVFLLYGLKYLSAAESGILTSTMPAMLALLSYVMLRERLSRPKLLAVACVTTGLVLMNYFGGDTAVRGSDVLLGGLLVLGAVAGESLFTIYGKMLADSLSPVVVATFVTLFGFLTFAPFAAWEALTFDFAAVPPSAWLALFLYGSLITVIPFVFICEALKTLPANTAAVFTGVMPVSGLLSAFLVLGEPILWWHSLGIGGVFAGIAALSRERPDPPRA